MASIIAGKDDEKLTKMATVARIEGPQKTSQVCWIVDMLYAKCCAFDAEFGCREGVSDWYYKLD
jgi:hypothetical protein